MSASGEDAVSASEEDAGSAPDGDPVNASDEGTAATPDDEPAMAASPRWDPSSKLVAGVGLVVAGVIGLYLARNVLTLVALAGLLAFLVAPLIRVLQRRARFPKVLALLTSYLVVGLGFALIGGLIVGGIVASFSEVDPEEAADTLRDDAVGWLERVRSIQLAGYEIDFSESVDPMIERLETAEPFDAGDDADDADDAEDDGTIRVGGREVNVLLGGLVTSVQTLGGVLVTMLVTFLIALYLSADSHRFHAGLLSHVPQEYADDGARVSQRIGGIWRGYLYGQLVNSLATGLLVWGVLWAVGLPGAFVLGLIMALLNMIPTFGPIIAAVPGVIAAIAFGSTRLDWSRPAFALLVIVIYIVVVQLQANLMAPFITGMAVQMSPATILIGLLVGFQVGGLVGSLLVVPVLATLKEVGLYVIAKLLDRDPFEEDVGTTRSRPRVGARGPRR